MKKKILLVENEQGIIDFMEKGLKAVGYDVIYATDGASGLELAKNKAPDLVILDVILPDVNGFSICGFLKGNDKYRSIPLIILTGHYDAKEQVFDDAYKPDAFFNKPFDFSQLLETIRKLIGKTK
ncbi:MAG TPA: response regulator [Candidatus Omnitrophota bacterium]|nr:response regulator [Candidatus Omnitrophota bacterium]HPB68014.1 response regulator [Candidatus Omnitrophota bacterium]HQO58444.1 response regulator [Candidatus Omnitrophota bacterium]